MMTKPYYAQYKVVVGSTVDELERSVTALIERGWIPFGGVAQHRQAQPEAVGGDGTPGSQMVLMQAMGCPAEFE